MTNLPPGLSDPLSGILGGLAGQSQLGTVMSQLYPFQLAEPMAQYGLDQTLANQNYGNTMAGLGIQQGGVQRQVGALPKEQGLANQLLGLSGQELGISRGQLGLQRERLGLQGQSLDITEQSERQAAERATRGSWSSAAARGATNTSGFRQGLGDINQSLAQQLAQLGLSRQGQGISSRGLDLQGQGLDISGQRLGINQQQSDLSFGLRSGSLSDQLAMIGLNQGQAGQGLTNALNQAALNAQSGVVNTGIGQVNSLIQGAQGIPGYAGQAGALAPAPQSAAPPNVAPQQGSVHSGSLRLS